MRMDDGNLDDWRMEDGGEYVEKGSLAGVEKALFIVRSGLRNQAPRIDKVT